MNALPGQIDIEDVTGTPNEGIQMNFDAMSIEQLLKLEVHEYANRWPMISKEEIDELAEDIKKNGVNHPIVVTADGVLIDGRNRLAACKVAGVTPPINVFEGEDINAFIVSENANRRHLTKSQRAMLVAVAFPEAEKVKRKGVGSLPGKELGTGFLSQARTVLKKAPDLVEVVIAGGMSIKAAYEQARDRESDEEKMIRRISKIASVDSELADAVSSGNLGIKEAEARIEEEQRKRKDAIFEITKTVVEVVKAIHKPTSKAAEYADFLDEEVAANLRGDISPETMRECASFLSSLADAYGAVKATREGDAA